MHAQAPIYPDGLIPVHHHEAPIVVDDEPRLATFEAQKVVIPDNPELEIDLQPPGTVHATVPPPLTATIWGFRRQRFYAILSVVILLLIGLIAGLAGGLTARRNNGSAEGLDGADSPNGAPSGSPTPLASPFLNNTQLATAQWKNETATTSYVVYQDSIGSLILAAWNDKNTEWTLVNISDRMLRASNPVYPKLGTPLVCVTGFWNHVLVIFLDQYNIIRGVATREDGYYMFWRQSELYDGTRIQAQPQSHLAAYWLYCSPVCDVSETDGEGKVRVFLEDNPGQFATYIGGSTPAAWVATTNFSGRGRVGSGLATTPYYRSASDSTHMVFFYDTGEKLGMMGRENNDTTWKFNDAFAGSTHATFPGQQIAATSFYMEVDGTPSGDGAILALQLENDGRLAATYWDPRAGKWTFGGPIQFAGGPQPAPAFKSIAMNVNRKFYGIVDGAILEYLIDNNKITRFVFLRSLTEIL